jgi:hypothetical protein
LAIPLFFSQIDGICYDLTSKIIYLRFIQKWRNSQNGMTDLFLTIKNSTPYNAWEKRN